MQLVLELWKMQTADARIHDLAIVGSNRRDLFLATDELPRTSEARGLWLSWLIHALSGSAFSVASGFTGRFFLLTRFWFGAIVGCVVYLLISLVLGNSDLL